MPPHPLLGITDPRHALAPGRGRTQWSRVRRLARRPAPGDDAAHRRGWEDAWLYLWETFRPAMLASARRVLATHGGGVVSPGEAEDVVQSFLLACLEKDYLARWEPASGRFRTFIAVCLRRHALKHIESRRRKKRAPAGGLASLAAGGAEPPARASGGAWDRVFDEAWVRCALDAALARVRSRSEPNERALRLLLDHPDLDPDDLALRLGLEKPRMRLRLHRARRMLAEELWAVVKETVADERELEDEKARLFRALSRHLDEQKSPSLFARPRPEASA